MNWYKSSICLLTFWEFCFFCTAQNIRPDNNKAIVSKEIEDTAIVSKLLILSKKNLYTAPKKAITYGIEARNLSKQLNDKLSLATALKNIGIAYVILGKKVEALDHFNQSLQIFDSIGDQVGVSNLLTNIGVVYFDQGDDVKALEYYFKSLQIAEKTGNKLRIATALQNIGAVYANKPITYNKALQFLLKALRLSEELGDKNIFCTVSVNLGEIYFAKGDDQQALYYFQKSLEAYESSETIPYSLNEIGEVYRKRGDYILALKYHQKAYETAQNLDAKKYMVQSLLGIADTYLKQGKIHSAIDSYKQAKRIALELHFTYELKNAYQGLAQSYGSLSDFRNAYKYQGLLTAIKDTMYNTETDKKLSSLLFDFELQKKQNQIDLLTRDKAIQQYRNNLILYVLAGSFMIILVVSFFLLHIKQLKREHMIRTELAKDLHDDLGSTLNSIKVYTNYAIMKKGEVQPLEKINETIQEAIISIRDIIWVLDDRKNNVIDLIARINQFAVPLCAANEVKYIQNIEDQALPYKLQQEEKRNLYLVIKEAINNTIKYANTSELILAIRIYNKGKLLIQIKDTGSGFDLGQASEGNGLKNMKFRAEQIGYSFSIRSAIHEGTVIEVRKENL